MGVAAYNRGSRAIAKQISANNQARPLAYELMDRFNAIPKKHLGHLAGKCHPPHDKSLIQEFRGVWWLMDAADPYGCFSWYYPSLHELLSSWDIALVGLDERTGIWEAINI